MNVFATLKTVFFGSKFLSSPVPIDGTPRRDLVSALNGLMPLQSDPDGIQRTGHQRIQYRYDQRDQLSV